VTVGDKGIKATPISPKRNKIAEMYGKKPTLVAEELDPMALIEKASPQDRLFPQYQGYGNKLVRSVLRRIVDEV
jgi:hypothetical protein